MAAAQPAAVAPPQLGQGGKDVMWLPTKDAMMERLFLMAGVSASDFLVDLGSGDGKIVISAARNLGARALGIEFNPRMVDYARARADAAGVAQKAQFQQGDIFATDFSKATVVTLYLLPELNLRLRPTLFKMKPGTRVVSNSWDMQGWRPDETSTVDLAKGFLWVIPANVAGTWKLTYRGYRDAAPDELVIRQRFQSIEGEAKFPHIEAGLFDAALRGDAVRFGFRDAKGAQVRLQAKVDGELRRGTFDAGKGRKGTFEARRVAGGTAFPEAVPTEQESMESVRVLGN